VSIPQPHAVLSLDPRSHTLCPWLLRRAVRFHMGKPPRRLAHDRSGIGWPHLETEVVGEFKTVLLRQPLAPSLTTGGNECPIAIRPHARGRHFKSRVLELGIDLRIPSPGPLRPIRGPKGVLASDPRDQRLPSDAKTSPCLSPRLMAGARLPTGNLNLPRLASHEPRHFEISIHHGSASILLIAKTPAAENREMAEPVYENFP